MTPINAPLHKHLLCIMVRSTQERFAIERIAARGLGKRKASIAVEGGFFEH